MRLRRHCQLGIPANTTKPRATGYYDTEIVCAVYSKHIYSTDGLVLITNSDDLSRTSYNYIS